MSSAFTRSAPRASLITGLSVAEAAASGPAFLWLGFVHREPSPLELPLVERLTRGPALIVVSHFDERKPA